MDFGNGTSIGIFWCSPGEENQLQSTIDNIWKTVKMKDQVLHRILNRITNIKSSFQLTFTKSMRDSIIENTNKYGRLNIRDWEDIDEIMFDAFVRPMDRDQSRLASERYAQEMNLFGNFGL